MNSYPNSTILVAIGVICAVSTLRGALSTVTTVPFVGQALQVLGAVYLVQLAWQQWGTKGVPDIKAWLPTPLPTPPSPSKSPGP